MENAADTAMFRVFVLHTSSMSAIVCLFRIFMFIILITEQAAVCGT